MRSRFEALKNYSMDKLEGSTAAVVGLGATGSVIAEHLARHGVNLILIDRDYLELNDLYSSSIYMRDQCDSALPKAEAAEEVLGKITEVEAYVENLDASNTDILEKADIIMDGADNLETRLLIDEYASENNVPWVYTAALAEKGFSMFIQENCFRCIFQSSDPVSSCEQNGVMREISSIAASKSCLKAINYLSGLEPDQRLEMIPEDRKYEIGSSCNCSREENIEVSTVCGDNKYQVFGSQSPENFEGDVLKKNEYLMKISYRDNLLTVFNSGRAIVIANSQTEAENIYREASGI